MHDRIGPRTGEGGCERLSIRQIAFYEFATYVNCAAMSFRQVIKNRNLMALVEQNLAANTADITCAAYNQNSHPRKSPWITPFINRRRRAPIGMTFSSEVRPSFFAQ